MDGIELRGSLMLLGADQLHERIGQETLVICGAPRGKTSMAAFTLFNLGYFLGDRLGPENYEDQDLLDLLPHRQEAREPELRSLISSRNASHRRWGFKLPHSTERLIELEPILRNPVFLVCLRNPLGVARTIMKRDAQFRGQTLAEYLEVGLRPFLTISTLIDEIKAPFVLVDMDEVSVQPRAFVQQLARLFKLNGPVEVIAESISVAGYKKRLLTQPEVSSLRKAKAESAADTIQRPRRNVVKG